MLEDYRKYLLNIRNNLIQCGVEFPINPILTYKSMFELEQKLDDVLFYYSILEVSGSENALEGFFLPLNGYYKEKMRSVYYQEFLDFLKDYKKISLSEALRRQHSRKSYFVGGEVTTPVEEVHEEEETHGVFIDEDEEAEEAEVNGVFIDEEEEVPEEEVHGVFIDEDDEAEEVEVNGVFINETLEDEDTEYVSNGRYLEDEPEEQEEISNISQETIEGYVSHGKYLDEDSENYEDDGIRYDENGFEIVDEPEEYEEPEDFEDDGIRYDENGFEIIEETEEYKENSEEGFEEFDDGIRYDENGFEIVEEPEGYNDSDFEEELEDDGIRYDENGFEIIDEPEELEDFEDDGIRYDENGFEIVDEPEEEYEKPEDFELSIKEGNNPKNTEVTSNIPKKITKASTNKDLADILQDFTNGLLTSGKKSVIKAVKKFKE